MFGGARAFKDMFDDAMQGGCVEVRFVLVFRTEHQTALTSAYPHMWVNALVLETFAANKIFAACAA